MEQKKNTFKVIFDFDTTDSKSVQAKNHSEAARKAIMDKKDGLYHSMKIKNCIQDKYNPKKGQIKLYIGRVVEIPEEELTAYAKMFGIKHRPTVEHVAPEQFDNDFTIYNGIRLPKAPLFDNFNLCDNH